MSDPEERDLRDRFAELRDELGRSAPSYAATRNRAARAPRASRRPAVLVAAIGVAALVLLLVREGNRRPAPVAMPLIGLSDARWRAPTDFLLATPGSELLNEVPRFGAPLWSGPRDSTPTVRQ